MAVKTPTRMYGPAQLPSASATRYTVPAGKRSVVRQIHIINPTGGAVTFTLSIGTDAAGTRLFEGVSLAAGQVFDRWGYWVLSEAEVIDANSSSDSSIVMSLFGDEYSLATTDSLGVEYAAILRTIAGKYYYMGGPTRGGSGTVSPAADTASYAPLEIATPTAVSFDRIGCEVVTPAGSATFRLGLHAMLSTGRVGIVLLDAGLIDASVGGVAELTIDLTLQPGHYWGVLVPQTVTAFFRSTGVALKSNWFGYSSAAGVMGSTNGYPSATGVSGTLVDSPTVTEGIICPYLFLRAA